MKDENIKNRIAQLIKENGNNSSEFARIMGMRPNNLSTVLTGKDVGVSATILKCLSSAGYSVDWILEGKGQKRIALNLSENETRNFEQFRKDSESLKEKERTFSLQEKLLIKTEAENDNLIKEIQELKKR